MSDIDNIKARLFSVLPTSSLHMIQFLKLMDIRYDNNIPSAAITCSYRPELLLNKDFINTYCKTDEHLFMLVMHELYHIILGHTHLFKKHTEIDNIAFDAVINAILCRMFPEEEYVSFFTSINTDKQFPNCLLRPIGNNTPLSYIHLLKNLYYTNTGTYYEVYECIANELNDMLMNGKTQYVLLGNHQNNNNEDINNSLARKMIDDLISNWPQEILVRGKDLGGDIEDEVIDFAKTERRDRIKMNRLLKKSGILDGALDKKHRTFAYIKEDVSIPFIDCKDRSLLTKSMIYGTPLLYNSSLVSSKIINEKNVSSLVYLDVSGSVTNELIHFFPLLLKPYKEKKCLLFVFSTEVMLVTYKDFKRGKYRTTWGTSIDCIFEHYFSLPRTKRSKKILILTDGETGSLSPIYFQKIKQHKLEIYVGLFGNKTKNYLANITKYYEEF